MKEKIKAILIKYWKIILIILIAVGLFYWFQIRPSQIYSSCHKQAVKSALKANNSERAFDNATYETYYKQCLRVRGIDK